MKRQIKLSKVQEAVLSKMKKGEWYSSYNLDCRITTMEVLHREGLVELHPNNSGVGSIAFAGTHCQYRRVQ